MSREKQFAKEYIRLIKTSHEASKHDNFLIRNTIEKEIEKLKEEMGALNQKNLKKEIAKLR